MLPAVQRAEMNDPRLVFDEAGHRYSLDGRDLISVTQALTAAGMVDTTRWNEVARLRGQYVHQCIALEAAGELDESTVDPLVRPYFEAFRLFQRETSVTLEMVERRVCDPVLGYAGTLDAIGRWPSGKRTLFDWKSGFFPPMAGPQTAAYLRCARLFYPVGELISRAGLHLRGDGTYRLIEFTNIVQDEHDFVAALRVARFRRRHALAA
jgi:hypothetical protein